MFTQIRTLVIYSIIFILLFVLHIVFAANDYHLLFRIIALLITVMTFSGPICVLIEPSKQRYRTIYIQGLLMSIPLSIGLGWAYSDMSVGSEMILFPLITLVFMASLNKAQLGTPMG